MNSSNMKLNIVRPALYAIMAGCVLGVVGGCGNGDREDIERALTNRIEKLEDKKTELLTQLEQGRTKNKQLEKQVQVLSGLRAEVDIEDLYTLQRIKIHKYTGFYDKDEDGKKEKLIVYVQPIDKQGDIIKVPGSADVELWDLNKDAGQAKLGRWHVKQDELKKIWFTTLIKGNYRLMFDIAEKVDDFGEPLTVKVTFTDYLTGRVFKEQRVIKPR